VGLTGSRTDYARQTVINLTVFTDGRWYNERG
jgi:hypothetical protein